MAVRLQPGRRMLAVMHARPAWFDEVVERAREAHASVTNDPDAFWAFIVGCMGEVGRDELASRHVGDLWLACACARGDAAGLAALEQVVMPAVERALASFAEPHELVQMLRAKMLVGDGDELRIAAYDGRAPLAVWLRVCCARLGMRRLERQKREQGVDDAQLDQLAPGVPDPELAYLKRLYGEQFRKAFAEAVASLEPRERTLLRLSVLDDLSVDQIGAIFHVHRATAARQLKHARDRLVETTRERMRVVLRVSASELESIMRMITNLADITLRQVFANRSHARETE